MEDEAIDRKEFMARLGKLGAGACMCAAAAGMGAAFGGQSSAPKPADASAAKAALAQTKPGEKTAARAAKRMEFGDGWVGRFFDAMDRTLDENSRKKLMMANGKACFSAYAGPSTAQPGPDAVEKFVRWVEKNGGERGYSIEGKAISFEFVGSAETGQASPESVCLCPMAETQTPGKFSPTYCLCSLGYVKEMHERRLGRPVEVELVDSVLRGGKRCKFRMTIA